MTNNSRGDSSGIPGSNKFGYSCFRDNERSIDFVLVYREDNDTNKVNRREEFLNSLGNEGLELEIEPSVGMSDRLHFVKIHIPDDTLKHNAGILDLKLTYREESEEVVDRRVCKHLLRWFKPEVLKPALIFRTPYLEELATSIDLRLLFPTTERIKVVWNILTRAKYGPEERQFGISKLLNNGTYMAAFPLHEGTFKEDPPDGTVWPRRLLYLEWAHFFSAYQKEQPLHLIKNYFGEEVALYFAWLGLYTKLLLIASILGLIVFMYGLVSLDTEDMIPSKEICASDLILCPTCVNTEMCKFIPLRETCIYSKVSYLFDNPITVLFAIVMSFWGTVFMEMWKREQNILSWRWDLMKLEIDDEIRPDFEIRHKKVVFNPVTGKYEPYVSYKTKAARYLGTTIGILIMCLLAVGAFFGLIYYKVSLKIAIEASSRKSLKQYKSIIISMSSAIISLIVMMILEIIFIYLADVLTKLENPRTQSEFDDSFTFKVYIFEFINFYSSLIYIAFFKGAFFTFPSDDHMWTTNHGLNADVCDPSGCLSELFMQLSVVMVGKQVFSNFIEYFLPKVMILWRRYRYGQLKKLKADNLPQWERDFALTEYVTTSLFDEQLEMVIQYGFVTLFVVAFPLAPLFALLNNIVEIRVDAYKLLVNKRRALPRKVRGLGAWEGILQSITYIAVAFNAFLIAFTSDSVERFIYRLDNNWKLNGFVNWSLSEFDTKDYKAGNLFYKTCRYRGHRYPPTSPDKYSIAPEHWQILTAKLLFVVTFEHLILSLVGILAYAVPDIPRSVKQLMAIERLDAINTRQKFMELNKKLIRRRHKKQERDQVDAQDLENK